MELTVTTQGQRRLIFDGHVYVYQKQLANNVDSWECEHRRRNLCKAKVKMSDDQVIEEVNEHSCGNEHTKIEVTRIRAEMKRKAETTIDAPQMILSGGPTNASDVAAVNLPRLDHVRRATRRQTGGDDTPAIPQNRIGIPVIPNEFQQTINDNRFLLHDSCVGDPNRLLIFATDEGLSLLESSDRWFADVTFSVSPNIFFQVYTVHTVFHGRVLT